MNNNKEEKVLSKHSRLNTGAAISMSLALLAPWSSADIVGGELTGGAAFANGGVFESVAAPAVLGNNAYEDNNVRAFNEQQDVTLTETLIADIGAPDLDSNVLGAGSIVSSHYIIFDPPGLTSAVGTVTFDAPVVGVISFNPSFNETDVLLGNPTTNYAIGDQGLENNDEVTIVGNTIEFDLISNSPGDAIRVITSNSVVPGINVCGAGTETLFGVITGGTALAEGGQFRQICDPIGPVGNDNFDSVNLYAFEEQQAVELVSDLFLDATNVITAGEFVSSFYVVWDPLSSTRVFATITFPDTIIGVIGDRTQLQDSEFLGNASATYLNPAELGLEPGDVYTVDDNELSIDFAASSPGDSIRVILGSASPSLSYNICDPADETVSGSVTGGTAFSAGGTFSQLCEPIGPVGNNNLQANDLFVFEEMQNVVLIDDLNLDDSVTASIPTGTELSSYYVAFDPASTRDIVGSITFPGKILGMATSIATLNDSDFLGNTTAVYLNPSLRGLESNDLATYSADTLSVNFDADSPGDYIRVFVATGPVDYDGDGLVNNSDNCIELANADQLDTNGDGFGNLCDPDLDNNGVVNFLDISLFVDVFGSAGALDADLNGDGFVNFIDFALVPSYFGSPPGPSGLVGFEE